MEIQYNFTTKQKSKECWHKLGMLKYEIGDKCKVLDFNVSSEITSHSGMLLNVIMQKDHNNIWIDAGLVIPADKLKRLKEMNIPDRAKYLNILITAEKYKI